MVFNLDLRPVLHMYRDMCALSMLIYIDGKFKPPKRMSLFRQNSYDTLINAVLAPPKNDDWRKQKCFACNPFYDILGVADEL